MLACTTTANQWPARCAYTAAGIFIGASGATNVAYGWGKGTDIPTCFVWAAVAGAVAILGALAWPAFIRSVEMRRGSAAVMSAVALLLALTYSTVAALGSAAGARMTAAATETATTGVRQRAEDAYAAAKADLAKLAPSRPAGELEALLAAARPVCRVHVAEGVRQTVCGKPAALEAELARARQRERLQAAVDRAAEALAAAPPRVANSDARALGRYLSAVGLDVSTDRLNDLLVILAIAMVEAGTGLSLAVGMALADRPTAEQPTSQATANDAEKPDKTATQQPPAEPLAAPPAARAPVVGPDRSPIVAPLAGLPEAVVAWLAANGGTARSVRTVAAGVGRPPSSVGDAVRRLAAARRVVLARGAGGRTTIELAPIGALN